MRSFDLPSFMLGAVLCFAFLAAGAHLALTLAKGKSPFGTRKQTLVRELKQAGPAPVRSKL